MGEDEDGIDGPWERAMDEAIRQDGVDAQRSDECRERLDDLGFCDSEPCPRGPYVHHPGKRCLGCGAVG